MIKLEPLSILKARKLDFVPPHFSKISVDSTQWNFKETISEWIENKLSGRYSVILYPGIDKKTNKQKNLTVIAFEEEKELTYFMLACPHIRS